MRLSIHHLSLLLWCIHTSQSSPRFVGDTRVFGHRRLVDEQYLSFRGGSNQSDDFPIPEESRWTSHNDERLSPLSLLVDAKSRHCSDLVFDIRRRSTINGDQDESLDLRRLITRRSLEYLNELAESSADNSEDPSKRQPLPHPRKLLHFLAPKVPAIKHSPDVNLRIHSARSDIDSGVAACIISTLAHVFEMYSKQRIPSPRLEKSKKSSAPIDITSDRRFEQLIECVLSGVNVEKRNREALRRRITIDSEHAEDIDELLDEENLEESDGLSTRDACRAAWGIAMLGAHHMENLGGEKVIDLLQALSLRTRELLLARLKLLRQDDLLSEPALAHLTIEERINELAHELAEDAASAMWTFACVKAYTGLRSVALFETCCSILCQNPVDLRRRAQEIDDEHVAKSVGNNDIVDRLGRVNSNDDEEEEKPMRNVTSVPDVIFADKDTLLDWLSKAQINDIMWALAIHGRENTTSSIDDIRLSETAAVLGEIAFDRLIEALERDLQEAESENEDVSESSNRKKVVGTQVERDEESMTVEVVDAAALLASQARGSAHVGEEFVKKLPVESMVLRGSSFLDYPIQQVEVVDAATLLAASEGDGSMSIETEIMISSPPSEAGKEFNGASQPSKMIAIVREATKCSSGSTSGKRFFSPHDLASIAWSVTELHDPLRMQIVPMVIKLVAMLGQSGTEFLSGADLANLAWAISKYEAKASIDKAHSPDSLSLSLISWISLTALQRVTKAVGSTDESDSNVLNQFQPPELGRLLWAVSCVMSTYTLAPDPVRKDDNIYELAKLALITASMNLSLFGTEDLLRICWSFLELCGHDDSLFDPQTSISLGRILSTVEQSLYRWERGDCTTVSNAGSNPTSLAHEVPIFSSFFGRSRVNQPLLEQVVCDQDDDDDDNKFAPLLPKARRPLLRDLSVDPSTLCKAACAFQRLSLKHPEIKGGWKLTNVAIRLLTSKNARLLKECSVHDIIRLCEAAVRSEAESHGRELITGLFAHKVVQVLNDVLSESADSQRSTSIIIDAASPVEAATLIWALGNLGVKHSLSDESRGMAYKRLHLVTETALLTTEQVQQLDSASSAKLVSFPWT